MNGFRMIAAHYRLFRQRRWWWWIWGCVWFVQLLRALPYWFRSLDGPLVFLSTVAIFPALLMVFVAGNLYSGRNNPFLKTRPVPASTCFAVDCALPFALYMIIPLLREVPVVVIWNFGITDLFWAWLDTLVIHALAFVAAWLTGASLPRLDTHLRWAMLVLYTGATIVFFSALGVMAFGPVEHVFELAARNDSGSIAYFTTLLALLALALPPRVTLGLRLRPAAGAVALFLVAVPAAVFCVQSGGGVVERALEWCRRHRTPPKAEPASYDLQCPSYLDEFRDRGNRKGDDMEYLFNVFGITPSSGRAARTRILATRLRHEGKALDLRVTDKAWEDAWSTTMQDLLLDHYGTDRSPRFGSKSRPPLDTNHRIGFRGAPLQPFRGRLVRLEHDLSIQEYRLAPLLVGAAPGTDFRDDERRGKLLVTNPQRYHRVSKYTQYAKSNTVRIVANVFMRQPNLFWKRLFAEEEPERALAVVFRQPDTGVPEVVLHRVRPWRRGVGGAFPSSGGTGGTGHGFWGSFRFMHPDAPQANKAHSREDFGFRDPDKLVFDLFEMVPTRRLHGSVAEEARPSFTIGDQGDHQRQLHRLAETQPLTALEEVARGRSTPETFYDRLARTLARTLASVPAEDYRELLFRATRVRPGLAPLIIQNGWEEEAMDVWLDLARQRRALPPQAVLAFVRLGDERLKAALLDHQRYAPLPELAAIAPVCGEWGRTLTEVTEESVDQFYRQRLRRLARRSVYFARNTSIARWIACGHWVGHDKLRQFDVSFHLLPPPEEREEGTP